jgi:hypothetical protein
MKKLIKINPVNKMGGTKINSKKLYKVNGKMKDLLKLKDETITFIELRKKFNEYISKNDLYDKTNGLYILINDEISQKLNLTKNHYLHFDMMDSFLISYLEFKEKGG